MADDSTLTWLEDHGALVIVMHDSVTVSVFDDRTSEEGQVLGTGETIVEATEDARTKREKQRNG